MRPRGRHPGQAGFTIMELTIVMGLLAVFMMFLVNIMFTSTEVFSTGQRQQELTARGIAGRRPVEESLRSMLGPTRESRSQASDARLVAQWEPIGFRVQKASGLLQVLRSTARVDRRQERKLLSAAFEPTALEALGQSAEPEKITAFVAQMIGNVGFKGRAEMLLLPWPSGDAEGAYLELRRGFFLPGRSDVMRVRDFGEGGFDARRVLESTEVIATGLLHLAYRFGSQRTVSWTDGPEAGGPEWVWDSARVGWLLRGEDARDKFGLDLGAPSAEDSSDDVYPRYVEVTVVAGLSEQDLPESQLVHDISEEDKTIRLATVDRLPDEIHDNYLKIGSEWVRFAELDGRTLRGVKRGQRRTQARAHQRGTGVRAGKTEILMIEVPHARDSWNG